MYHALSAGPAFSDADADRFEQTRRKHSDDPLLKAGAVHLSVDALSAPASRPAAPASRTDTHSSVSQADLERLVTTLDAQGWQIIAEASSAVSVTRVLEAFSAAASLR